MEHDLGIVLVNKACVFTLSPFVFCVSKKISDMFYTGVKLVLRLKQELQIEESIYLSTNALNEIQFITSIEFLHVLVPGCHP